MTSKRSIITPLICEEIALSFSRNNESWLYNPLAVDSIKKVSAILTHYSFSGAVEVRFNVEEITLHCRPENRELNSNLQKELDNWQAVRGSQEMTEMFLRVT